MRNVLYLTLLFLLAAACSSTPPVPKTSVTEPAVSREPAKVESAFVVSAEVKQRSLSEIKVLIDRLNAIIARKDFAEWKTYLDQDYVRTYSDPTLLKSYTEKSPFLKKANIKLKSLEDYFKFVVVPSRTEVQVDDISFVDEVRINVWTVVEGETLLLYHLKLYEKEWKISSW